MLAGGVALCAFSLPILGWCGVSAALSHLRARHEESSKTQDVEGWVSSQRRLRGKSHPLHMTFITVNLVVVGLVSVMLVELSRRGKTRLYGWSYDDYSTTGEEAWWSWPWVLLRESLVLLVLLAWQSVLEYPWHLALHRSKWCLKHIHKYHHYYRHPGPFDDLFSHPLENASYLLLLTSPALLWPLKGGLHVATFGAYVASMGLFTMLDHAGLQADIPGLYASVDHELHHSQGATGRGAVNLAFPFPFMDKIAGTYVSGYHHQSHSMMTKRKEETGEEEEDSSSMTTEEEEEHSSCGSGSEEEEEDEGQQQGRRWRGTSAAAATGTTTPTTSSSTTGGGGERHEASQ